MSNETTSTTDPIDDQMKIELPDDIEEQLEEFYRQREEKLDDDGYFPWQKQNMEKTIFADTRDRSYAIRSASDDEFFIAVHAYAYAQAVAMRVKEISDEDAELIRICLNLSEEIMTTTKRLWWNKCAPLGHSIGTKFVNIDDNGSRRRDMCYVAKGLLADIDENLKPFGIDIKNDHGDRHGDTIYTIENDWDEKELDGTEVKAKKGDTVNVTRELRTYVYELYYMLDNALSEYLYS